MCEELFPTVLIHCNHFHSLRMNKEFRMLTELIGFMMKLLTVPGLGRCPHGLGPFLNGICPGLKRGRHLPCPGILMHLLCSGQSVLLLQDVGGTGLQTLSVHEVRLTQSLSLAQLERHIPRLFRTFA